MARRIPVIVALGLLLAFSAACTNKKVNNPLANVGSKQPDKVLFDRAMDAMKHNRFDVARMTLQTLINTYPDSEFVARAKLAIGDSWYAEGGSAALAQAESEYKDFETFFPNMAEAAEAQLKIANIHYQQMEKPDRDFTHAMRAEEEYRALIMQYPDSKLVPEAKQHLLEVQEVLAEREYEIGRFYLLRQSYPASIARLKSVAEKYPLYSKADEVLFSLGQAYEGEIDLVRGRQMQESIKARLIQQFTTKASEAYSKIITRYPLQERSEDAKLRLEALHQPVPKPTKAAVAQNKAELDSRKTEGMMSSVMGSFQKHPSVAQATRVGEPPLVDPTPISATEVSKEATQALLGTTAAPNGNASVEVLNNGTTPPPSDAVPHSGDVAPGAAPADGSTAAPPATTDNGAAAAAGTAGTAAPPAGANPPAADPNELKPNAQADPNELKPSAQPDPNELKVAGQEEATPTLPAPTQVNEIDSSTSQGAAGNAPATDEEISSSKPKKKKGIHKVVPF
jgi:outer membrane protein assembly factor BamD